MKQNNFKLVFLLLLFVSVFSLQAQQKSALTTSISNEPLQLTEENQRHFNETGFVRCATVEMEALRRQSNTNIQSDQEFENWLAPLIQERQERIALEKANGTYRRAVVNIPIIFHVITGSQGDANDISAARIQAQIDQLNLDFNNLSGSTDPVAESAEINFIPAAVDPNGNVLPEPGINRVYGYTGTIATNTMNATIKPATIWDRSLYANIWSANLGGGVLGYAQFPSNSTLPGLDPNGGSALTDGVVVIPGSIGSLTNSGTAAPYNAGRTLTHEIGHWIGLRHIWGDSNCGNDFCADTPESSTSNFGCPTNNQTTCDGNRDMVENYMDYTDDACMNIFTADQVSRILTVLENADGISNLPNSTTGSAEPTILISTTLPSGILEGDGCGFQDIEITLTASEAGNASATATLSHSGTATENTDFELINNSVSFPQGDTTGSNTITLRVFEDGMVETDETITLNVNVSTTGDLVATTNTYVITITNEDTVPTSSGNTVLFSDGFESYTDWQITPVGAWTMLDNDGDTTYAADNNDFPNEGYTGTFIVFNPSQGTPVFGDGWNPHSGTKGYYCFNSTGSSSGTPENDDYIFTPQISLDGTNSELKFWAQSLTDNYAGGERFQVGISTTDTNPASFTIITPAPYVIPPLEWTEYTYDLSAYDGQDIYITFHVVSADEFVFMLDDVSVTADTTTGAQTLVNTATTAGINEVGMAYFTDTNTGNVMIDVDNTGGFNYACVDVSVSRDVATAGAAAVMYGANTDPDSFVTAKTFNITTTNVSTSDTSTINFYFSEAELAGWEALTGNSRSELFVKNELTNEVAAITISAFGSDSKLAASFTAGLEGIYVFGTQLALLSVDAFEMASTLSVYPNPTTSVLNIKTTDANLPDSYAVYNMLGQVVKTATILGASDLQINTSDISNGMYFIKIRKDNSSLTIPFIKK
ncbi:choice-of-anchor J domain-containing protein [Bizionia sp.]|uniref:choice-of-anchor J domain-containing protein n=1 Tax=Bizionia sp. TaxID=1954480 RepID=UPI003A8E889C